MVICNVNTENKYCKLTRLFICMCITLSSLLPVFLFMDLYSVYIFNYVIMLLSMLTILHYFGKKERSDDIPSKSELLMFSYFT